MTREYPGMNLLRRKRIYRMSHTISILPDALIYICGIFVSIQISFLIHRVEFGFRTYNFSTIDLSLVTKMHNCCSNETLNQSLTGQFIIWLDGVMIKQLGSGCQRSRFADGMLCERRKKASLVRSCREQLRWMLISANVSDMLCKPGMVSVGWDLDPDFCEGRICVFSFLGRCNIFGKFGNVLPWSVMCTNQTW